MTTYLGDVVYRNIQVGLGEIRNIKQMWRDGLISQSEGKKRITAILTENAEILEPNSEEARFLESLMGK